MTRTELKHASNKALCIWILILGMSLWAFNRPFIFPLLTLWVVGTLLSCTRKIPIGCVGDLEMYGTLRATLDTGYTRIIPIFPIFLVFNRYLIRIKTRSIETGIGGKERVVNQENFHHLDSREAQKKVVMQTGALGMLSFSTSQDLKRALSDVDHPSHFTVLSLPVMLLFYILLIVSIVSGKMDRNMKEAEGEFTLLVALKQIPAPIFPDRLKYVKKGEEKRPLYFEQDGRRYFYHPVRASDTSTVHVGVEPNECYLVLAGEEIVFETKIPPVFVANMEVLATYTPKDPYLPWYWKKLDPAEEWKKKYLPSFLLGKSDPWRYIYSNWNEVDTRYNLVATAFKQNEISQKAGGGLVCF